MVASHTHRRGRRMVALCWTLQIIAAGILLQTLYFKFTGAEESRFIFRTLGVEPWGRHAAAVAELVTAILLVIPGTAAIGAALGLGVISGAIGAHLTRLASLSKATAACSSDWRASCSCAAPVCSSSVDPSSPWSGGS